VSGQNTSKDFPEQNSANLVNGQYKPAKAARHKNSKQQDTQVTKKSKGLKKKMFKIAAEAKKSADNSSKVNKP
jgi:hypothetical protein